MPKLALIGLLLALAGCSQMRYELGERLNAAHANPPPQGTGMAAVLAQLGPPLRVSSSPSGYLMSWEHWQVHEDSVGVSLGVLGADFLSVDWGDARIRGEFAVVTFDRDKRVSGSAYSRWDNDGGGGSAIQPFVGIADVVDVDDLLEPLPQHRWAGTLLEELPRALNRQSRPGQGGTGIQQRGTPNGIGQQSLEAD